MNSDDSLSRTGTLAPTAGVPVLRVFHDRPHPEMIEDSLVVESLLNLDIRDVGSYGILCSPNERRELAVGFAFSEGMIESRNDIRFLRECEDDPGTIRMGIARPERVSEGQRNLLVVSSCGMCGSQVSMEEQLRRLPSVTDRLRLPRRLMSELPARMVAQQGLFARTGGAHAAALFTSGADLLALGEDVGRHNALDKAIGHCLLAGTRLDGSILVLSGRVSFELMAKAARAGVELIAAISAPSALAVDAATRCNVTLCGFVREGRFTVYTHPWRVEGLDGGQTGGPRS